MISTSSETHRSAESAPRTTREQARAHVVRSLAKAEAIADAMSPGSADYDVERVHAYINIATEWRYLSEEL